MPDPELEAMQVLVSTFERLDEQAQARVYRWFTMRYGSYESAPAPALTESVALPPVNRELRPERPKSASGGVDSVELERLYATVAPAAQWERVLLTGYWLQEVQHREDFDAAAIMQALRPALPDVSNISRELTKLVRSGLLAVQQSGANGVAVRRRFRVTREGLRWVKKRSVEPDV